MNNFELNIQNIYGKKGREWLQGLPKLIADLTFKYGLSDLKPLSNLSYNYVLAGLQEKRPIILKTSPDRINLKKEACALQAFGGYGAVNIIDIAEGMLLLEHITPGSSLKKYFPFREQDSIEIVCQTIKKLHAARIPPDHNFLHIRDWLLTLDKDWDIKPDILKEARRLRDQLLQTSSPDTLLHGDLHHDNILLNSSAEGDNWLVIDPKGVIGEPAYEVGAFIRNPIPELLEQADAKDIIQNRIKRFAVELGIPYDRINNWCFVQSVLAWIWAQEDGCDTKYFERMTDVFERLQT